jgi:hypothetical protein
MTEQSDTDKLKQWSEAVGNWTFVIALEHYMPIIAKPNFDELLKKRQEQENG